KVMEQLNSQLLLLINISHLAECPDNHDAILANEFEKKLFEDDSCVIEYLQIAYFILYLGSEENKQRVANAVKDKVKRLADNKTLQELGKEQNWNEQTKKDIQIIVEQLYQLIKEIIGKKENQVKDLHEGVAEDEDEDCDDEQQEEFEDQIYEEQNLKQYEEWMKKNYIKDKTIDSGSLNLILEQLKSMENEQENKFIKTFQNHQYAN
ncbi:MAG: hypothetical protein EZS28_048575, partial [Streblomastix strix]